MAYDILPSKNAPIKVWTEGVAFDEGAKTQLRNIAELPFVQGVAVMPDVHKGVGATIGSVIATKNAVIPSAVGVDIGCLDHETEYLTPNGWKYIKDFKTEDEILVYSPENGIAFFEHPKAYIKRESEGFYHLKTKYGINQKLSPDHIMLVYHAGKERKYEKWSTEAANWFVKEHEQNILGHGGRINTTPESVRKEEGVDYSDEELRVMVMVAADCHILKGDPAIAVLNVKKQRKFDRAKDLLEKAGVPILSANEYENGRKQIKFHAVFFPKGLQVLWGASTRQLNIIANEVLNWDGNVKDQVFFTRNKEEADFVQWAFLASGYRSVLRKDKHKQDGKIDYRVFRHENTKIGIKATPKNQITFSESEDGFEYCFTTSTGFFLIRRHGVTALTGNCGMHWKQTTLKASDLPDSLKDIRHAIETAVPYIHHSEPSPLGTVKGLIAEFEHSILSKHPLIRHDLRNIGKQVGTLGGGNHFIELCLDENDNVSVMLHSGSRGIGNMIGNYFINKAKEGVEKYLFGMTLKDKDLAFFPKGDPFFDDYWLALQWAQQYALVNRIVMMDAVMAVLQGEIKKTFSCNVDAVNCHHNYASLENHNGENVIVTRKGAVRARKTDFGIIPGSMGARSYIVRGKGNVDSFNSCSHGAGRVKSRTQGKADITLEDHIKATEGIECRKDAGVIDESPANYKDIDAVMAAQKDLVEVVHTLRQVLVVKG